MINFTTTYLLNTATLLILFGVFGHFFVHWAPKHFKNIILLILSITFYLLLSPNTIWLLLYSTAITYFFSFKVAPGKARNKSWMQLSILLLLAPLLSFKYYTELNVMLTRTTVDKIILPLGISFFTFQAISYIIDIYRGSLKPNRKFHHLLIYLIYFPKIVAGPIERAKSFFSQLTSPVTPSYQNVRSGGWLVSLGIIKKFIFGNILFSIVDSILNNPVNLNFNVLFSTMILARYSIFFDFSGYTDIARGISRTMGIELTENFKQPFRAKSISEFWQRWHISLSSWMRDYVFYPIALNLKLKHAIIIAIFTSFLALGLWHGASLNFIIYGLIQGAAVSINQLIKSALDKNLNPHNKWIIFLRSVLGWATTFFLIVCPTVVLFWLSDPTKVLVYFREIYNSLFVNNSGSRLHTFFSFKVIAIICAIALYEFLSLLHDKYPLDEWLDRASILVRWTIYLIVIFVVYICIPFRVGQPFRYSNF